MTTSEVSPLDHHPDEAARHCPHCGPLGDTPQRCPGWLADRTSVRYWAEAWENDEWGRVTSTSDSLAYVETQLGLRRRRSPHLPMRAMAAVTVHVPANERGRALDAERRVRELEARLALASEFRIPCPQPDRKGHDDRAAHLKPDDLIIRRRTDGQGDGWLILNPNQEPGDHVWTGSAWVYRGELYRDAIYRWTLAEALELGPVLAVEETGRFQAWVDQMRAERAKR